MGKEGTSQDAVLVLQAWAPQVYLPCCSDGKESACNAGDLGSIPGIWKIPWKGEWQPTPVFLTGKSHGQRSLGGYSSWGHKESGTTERLTLLHCHKCRDTYRTLQHNKMHTLAHRTQDRHGRGWLLAHPALSIYVLAYFAVHSLAGILSNLRLSSKVSSSVKVFRPSLLSHPFSFNLGGHNILHKCLSQYL